MHNAHMLVLDSLYVCAHNSRRDPIRRLGLLNYPHMYSRDCNRRT